MSVFKLNYALLRKGLYIFTHLLSIQMKFEYIQMKF